MLGGPEGPQSIEITVEPHAGIRRRCSRCQKPAPGYDCLPQRRWLFVPLWGIPELIHNRSGVGSHLAVVDIDHDGALDVVTSTNRGTFIFWNKMRAAKGSATKK